MIVKPQYNCQPDLPQTPLKSKWMAFKYLQMKGDTLLKKKLCVLTEIFFSKELLHQKWQYIVICVYEGVSLVYIQVLFWSTVNVGPIEPLELGRLVAYLDNF